VCRKKERKPRSRRPLGDDSEKVGQEGGREPKYPPIRNCRAGVVKGSGKRSAIIGAMFGRKIGTSGSIHALILERESPLNRGLLAA